MPGRGWFAPFGLVCFLLSHGGLAIGAPFSLDSLLLGTVYGMPVQPRNSGSPDLKGQGDLRLRVEQACARLNRTAPHEIDEVTYLMGCRLLRDKEVAFDLVLKGFDPKSPGVASFMESAKPILEKSICRNPDVLALGAEGIALRYTYRIRSTPVLNLNIGPGQCSATPEAR